MKCQNCKYAFMTPLDNRRNKSTTPMYNEAFVCGFAEWLYQNRWYYFDQQSGKWHYTFEMGTSISKATLEKHYRKTTAQLLNEYKLTIGK